MLTQAAWHHGKKGKLAVLWLGEHNLDSGNSPMSPKTPSPMVAILLILGGAVFGVLGGLHAIYTLLDLHNPRATRKLSLERPLLPTLWPEIYTDAEAARAGKNLKILA